MRARCSCRWHEMKHTAKYTAKEVTKYIHPPSAIHFLSTEYMNGCVPLSHSSSMSLRHTLACVIPMSEAKSSIAVKLEPFHGQLGNLLARPLLPLLEECKPDSQQ